MTWRRVDRLRERVAQSCGARPTWVSVMFVRYAFGHRVDVRFEWVGGLPPCLVHTDATSPRRAISAVLRVADHVQPGRRFRARDPFNQETLA